MVEAIPPALLKSQAQLVWAVIKIQMQLLYNCKGVGGRSTKNKSRALCGTKGRGLVKDLVGQVSG